MLWWPTQTQNLLICLNDKDNMNTYYYQTWPSTYLSWTNHWSNCCFHFSSSSCSQTMFHSTMHLFLWISLLVSSVGLLLTFLILDTAELLHVEALAQFLQIRPFEEPSPHFLQWCHIYRVYRGREGAPTAWRARALAMWQCRRWWGVWSCWWGMPTAEALQTEQTLFQSSPPTKHGQGCPRDRKHARPMLLAAFRKSSQQQGSRNNIGQLSTSRMPGHTPMPQHWHEWDSAWKVFKD